MCMIVLFADPFKLSLFTILTHCVRTPVRMFVVALIIIYLNSINIITLRVLHKLHLTGYMARLV
jgi:hypothetical protein